jgi:hypothetical protein
MSSILPQKPQRVAISGGGGTGSGIPSNVISGDSGLYINDNGDLASMLFKINGNNAMVIDKFRRLGINVDSELMYRLEINDPLGDCIKMWNKENKPSYLKNIDGDMHIDVEDRQLSGIRLFGKMYMNNQELLSPAFKLNYTNVSESGTAERNKCVVLDSDKSYYGMNVLSVDNLIINNSLTMDMDSDRFSLNIKNSTGKCLKLFNDDIQCEFTLNDEGDLIVFNNIGCVDISGDSRTGGSIMYPLQLTSNNSSVNSGVGIKFNIYNNSNIKRNMSSIETIIINNDNNMENSIIKFNNMKDGELRNTVTIRNDGYIICNTLLELSDMRKKIIVNNSDIHKSLSKINRVNTYDFYYTNDEKKTVHKGVMAQELHSVIPSAVNVSDEYTVSNKDLIGYLIDSIKALSASVEDINRRLERLEVDDKMRNSCDFVESSIFF